MEQEGDQKIKQIKIPDQIQNVHLRIQVIYFLGLAIPSAQSFSQRKTKMKMLIFQKILKASKTQLRIQTRKNLQLMRRNSARKMVNKK